MNDGSGRFLGQIRFLAIAVCASSLGHLLLYRSLFYRSLLGPPLIDPHQIRLNNDYDLLAFVTSALCVLAVVAIAGRSVRSRRAAIVAAVIAGTAAEAYFVAFDWIRVGWGELVAHDLWF